MKLPAAHAAQAPALRERRGILAKANKTEGSDYLKRKETEWGIGKTCLASWINQHFSAPCDPIGCDSLSQIFQGFLSTKWSVIFWMCLRHTFSSTVTAMDLIHSSAFPLNRFDCTFDGIHNNLLFALNGFADEWLRSLFMPSRSVFVRLEG